MVIRQRFLVLVGMLVTSLAGLGFALELGGAAHSDVLGETGSFITFGAPTVHLLSNLFGALTIGGLAVLLYSFGVDATAERLHNLVLISAAGWTVTQVLYLVFDYFQVVGTKPIFDQVFEANFGVYLFDTDRGRLLLIQLVMSALVAVVLALNGRPFWRAAAFLLAIATAWPYAELGHSGATSNHGLAVNSLVLHIVFVSIWTGGLAATLFAIWFGADRAKAVQRFSSIALLSISIVTITGVASAAIRIGSFANLVSEYGILVLLKATATVVLALLGARWRKRILPNIEKASGVISFAALETALLVFVFGLATGLARTAPPVDQNLTGDLTPAEFLTGKLLPPAWSWETAFTQWSPDLIWGLFAFFTTIFYLWGVRRLRARGDKWPLGRSLNWIIAMVVLVYSTSGGVAVYGEYLFSAHMIEHMLLTMLVPVGIVLSAPVTLVSRAIEMRHDGSRGMREWFLGIVHSKWVGIVGHPLVSTVVFALSLMVFYYSPLLSWATKTHLGHEWMVLHFLTSGYLFVQALMGIDPSPHRTAYPVRIILLMATMGFHAFFGLSLMTGTSLLLPEWFGAMGRTWGDNPLVDQQNGGAIAWGIGELPTLILSGMVVLSWVRSDEREAKRKDRQAERDNNAELDEYNQMLGKLK